MEEENENENENEKEDGVEDGGRMYYPYEVDLELGLPFYAALGLVRIKAEKCKDVRVVHKSQVRGDGVVEEYDE